MEIFGTRCHVAMQWLHPLGKPRVRETYGTGELTYANEFVRPSKTRIALRRSSDEDSVSLATRLKTSYRLFDTYRVIRTFFSSVDLIYHSN